MMKKNDYHTVSYTETIRRPQLSPKEYRKVREHYSFNYGKFLPFSKDASILDLGCSEGLALAWLLDEGFSNVRGVDADHAAIARARRCFEGRIPDGCLVVADILQEVLSQPDNSVDLILLFNVAEHFKKDDFIRLVKQSKRVIRDGGALIVQTLNTENPLNYCLFARDFTHEIPFTPNSLAQAMIMGGFPAEKLLVTPVLYRKTITSLPLTISSMALGALMKAIAFLMRIRMRETAAMIYCVARKH
jgi:cyclopropane fatty-acyl-phospholipid synthase-like methyltransferase